MTRDVLLIDTLQNNLQQRLTLFAPTTTDESCSITLEPMGTNPDTLLGVTIGPTMVPVAAQPELTAARLPCKHCFNAMSLLVHFARNNMQCPLCRKGSPTHKLSLHLSFPGEPWAWSVEQSIMANTVQEILSDSGSDSPLYFNIYPNDEILPVHATFLLYGRSGLGHPVPLHRLPTIAMRCRLEHIPHPFFSNNEITLSSWFSAGSLTPPPLRYRLPSTFARLLGEQIQDMQITFLRVHVYASYEGIIFDMAHMEQSAYPFPNDFVPAVDPSTEAMSFRHNNNDPLSNILHFSYTPSPNTILSILTLLSVY